MNAHLIHSLAWTLVHFLWQGCAIAAAFAIVMMALRRAPAGQRYLAGCVALTMMAAAPCATFLWILQRADHRIDPESTAFTGKALIALTQTPAVVDPTLLGIVIAWLCGACAIGLWVGAGWWQTRQLRSLKGRPAGPNLAAAVTMLARRIGSVATVRVVDSARVVAPMTIGVIKPLILIPAAMLGNLSPAHLEAIIAHELAHVRRLDFLINLIQAALEALLFYHPAVWWVSRVVRQEREYCCDDIAADVCGNRITYARALAELEALRSVSLRLGLSSQGGSLMKRIARLVGEGQSGPSRGLRSRLAAPMAALAMVGVTTAAFALAEAPKGQVSVAPGCSAEPAQPAEAIWYVDAARQVQEESVGSGEYTIGVAGNGPVVLDYVIRLDGFCAGEAAGHWLMLGDEAGVEAQPELMRWLRAAEALHEVKDLSLAEPPVDPAHMPSDGLLRAAQYAYPFNLFDLTPWVDPRVHDLLTTPQEQPASLLMLTRAQFLEHAIKVDLQPSFVRFHGDVALTLSDGVELNKVTADEMTVDYVPASEAGEDMLLEKVVDEPREVVTVEGQPITLRWRRVHSLPPQPPPPPVETPAQEEQPTPPDAPATPAPPAPTPEPAPKP